MWKKFLCLLISATLLFSTMPSVAWAQETVSATSEVTDITEASNISKNATETDDLSETKTEGTSADAVEKESQADEVTQSNLSSTEDEVENAQTENLKVKIATDGSLRENDVSLQEEVSSGTSDDITVNPIAPRPNWSSDWLGYANSGKGRATTTAKTPTSTAKESWTFDYKAYIKTQYPNASEPILAGSFVYVAVDNLLLKIDKSNGAVVKSAKLGSKVGYTSRPVYVRGVIVVPLDTGRVQALTADELICVWITSKVSDNAQVNSTITVDGDFVYVGTVDTDYVNYNNGYFLKINANTGVVAWQIHDEDEGYYWNGACVKGNYVIISTSAGTVKCVNKTSGVVSDAKTLGKIVNSDCVLAEDGSKVYLMSRDGKLNVISIDSNGRMSGISVVNLGLTGCASTPTISAGKMFVGGEVNNGGGSALAIVDLVNFSVQLVSNADGSALTSGGIKGAPLVSTKSDATYVYFTVNNAETTDWVNYTAGGGVYSYKLGDAEAKLIYDAKGHYQYCDSPVICDAQGSLYYINDSGTLFKLEASNSEAGKTEEKDKDVNNSSNNNSSKHENKGKHHSADKSSKKADKSKKAKSTEAKMNNKKDKSDKDKEDKKGEGKSELEKAKENKPLATQVSDDEQDDSQDQAFNYFPIAGILLGFLIICVACYFLLKQKKNKGN